MESGNTITFLHYVVDVLKLKFVRRVMVEVGKVE